MVSHNDFKLQHVHSADGQTLQQRVQNVKRPPFLGLQPCPKIPTGTETGLKGRRSQKQGLRPFPTHAWPICCRRVQSPGSRWSTVRWSDTKKYIVESRFPCVLTNEESRLLVYLGNGPFLYIDQQEIILDTEEAVWKFKRIIQHLKGLSHQFEMG